MTNVVVTCPMCGHTAPATVVTVPDGRQLITITEPGWKKANLYMVCPTCAQAEIDKDVLAQAEDPNAWEDQ